MPQKITIELSDKLIAEIEKMKVKELPIEKYIQNLVKTVVIQQLIRIEQQRVAQEAGQKKLEETKDW